MGKVGLIDEYRRVQIKKPSIESSRRKRSQGRDESVIGPYGCAIILATDISIRWGRGDSSKLPTKIQRAAMTHSQ